MEEDKIDPAKKENIGFVPLAPAHPFKDTRGRWRTKSLFREWETPDYPAYYNLGPEDLGGYRSLRKLYLAARDPAEYRFAEEALGGWDHFQLMITGCRWFREIVDEWRVELEVKMRSEALDEIKALVSKPKVKEATRLAAARYIAEKGWVPKVPKRGRPSKVEIEGQLKKESRAALALEEDARRIGVQH